MTYNKYKSYLISLGEVITEYAREAKQDFDDASDERKKFMGGYLSAFYRIVTLMQQHAEGYEISLEELGMEDLDEFHLM